MESEIYKPGEFAKLLNVTVRTLQRWDNAGVLKAYRTNTNRRFYTHEQYLNFISTKKQVIYLCENQSDLLTDEILIEQIKDLNPQKIEIIRDGNDEDGFKRVSWPILLDRCFNNEIATIYIMDETALPESGASYYKRFFERMGVELEILEERKVSGNV